jgi:hypothetical protein
VQTPRFAKPTREKGFFSSAALILILLQIFPLNGETLFTACGNPHANSTASGGQNFYGVEASRHADFLYKEKQIESRGKRLR